jgi:phospholipid/cholesterol/gamma-HCH transport system substrate-binding protein
MRDSRINYVMVGSFVLAMLVALVAFVALLSGRIGATRDYFTLYDNVSGIRTGSRVLYEGYAVGQVEEIEPVRDGGRLRFRLRLGIARGWAIPQDSVARIAATGLLAAMAVDIHGGTSEVLLAPGATIPSQSGGSLVNAMSDIAAQVTALSQTGLKPLLETLNRTAAAFGPLLEQRAPQLMDNLVALSSDLAAKTPVIADNVAQATGGMSRLFSPGNTRRLEDIMVNADHAVADLSQLAGSLHASKAKVDSLLATLDKVAADNSDAVGQSLKDLHYTLEAVARSIDSVTDNLEGTSRNMNEFSREIRRDPGLLLGAGRPREDHP